MSSGSAGERVVSLRAMDTRVDLHMAGSDAVGAEARIRDAWSRCLADSHDAPDVVVTVRHGMEQPSPSPGSSDLATVDLGVLMHQLSPLVTTRAIEHQGGGPLLMLHAAALAAADGRAVGLVAPSGTGKTTVCEALGAELGYVTDETLAVGEDLGIASYPKPLSVVVDGTWQKEQRSPDVIGLGTTPRRPVLAALVLLRRDGSAQPWLEEVPTVRALAALSPESSFLSRLGQRPLHRLAETVEQVGGLRVLHYAEAANLAPVVDELLAEAR